MVAGTATWVRDLGYEGFCLHGNSEVLWLLLDKVAKSCRPSEQYWQIQRQVSPTRGESRLHSARFWSHICGCHWVNKFSLVAQEPMSTSFFSHGLHAFGWDVTHSVMSHLVGTAAGVMRSWAVRRLQEPVRWVPVESNALHTVVTTSESSGPPSLAKTSIRRANQSRSFAKIHRNSNSHNNTETEARKVRDTSR